MDGYLVGGYRVIYDGLNPISPWSVADITGEKITGNYNFPVYLSLLTDGPQIGNVFMEVKSPIDKNEVLPRIFNVFVQENGEFFVQYGTAAEILATCSGIVLDRLGRLSEIQHENTIMALLIELEEQGCYAQLVDGGGGDFILDVYNKIVVSD